MAWLPLTLLTCSPNTHQGDPSDHQIKSSSLHPESTPNQLMALSATMVPLSGILFHIKYGLLQQCLLLKVN